MTLFSHRENLRALFEKSAMFLFLSLGSLSLSDTNTQLGNILVLTHNERRATTRLNFSHCSPENQPAIFEGTYGR